MLGVLSTGELPESVCPPERTLGRRSKETSATFVSFSNGISRARARAHNRDKKAFSRIDSYEGEKRLLVALCDEQTTTKKADAQEEDIRAKCLQGDRTLDASKRENALKYIISSFVEFFHTFRHFQCINQVVPWKEETLFFFLSFRGFSRVMDVNFNDAMIV